MYSLFLRGGGPNKNFLDFINGLINSTREMVILRHMVRNATKSGFYKDGSSSHVKKLGFLTRKPSTPII